MPFATRTGSFPIYFRRGGSEWQKDLDAVIAFAIANGFAGIDVGALPIADLKRIQTAGLRIGTIDLPQKWTELASADAGKRADAADAHAAYITAAVAATGVRNYFCVVIPEEHAAKRAENFARAVDGYGRLCRAIAPSGGRLVIEGWPGGGPHYSSLACSPADYRAFFTEVASPAAAINFDASHLVRMGIDPLRFLNEFASRIHHVHAKDTELLDDELYEHGNLQPATFAKGHGFGGHHWRYAIPGHGCIRWGRLFSALKAAGFAGAVSVELEDEDFNGSTDGEQRGLLASRDFLVAV